MSITRRNHSRSGRRLALFLFLLSAGSVCASDDATLTIYRCQTPSQAVSWQQIPCSEAGLQQTRRARQMPSKPAETAAASNLLPTSMVSIAQASGSVVAAPASARSPAVVTAPIPSGRRAARQCERADGSFYFTLSGCGSSPVYERTLVTQRIVGIGDPQRLRDAVIVSGNTAVDARSGEIIPIDGSIDTQVTRIARQVPDHGKVVDRRWACREARRQADVQRRERSDLGFSGRRQLDDEVWDMCNSTRRLDE